jgi:biotin carboxyl carrier protein
VNDIIAHIEAYYGVDDVLCVSAGKLIDTCVKQGTKVKKGEVLGWIE